MLAWCALIDRAAFAVFDLQIGKLLKSAANLGTGAKPNQVRLELPVQLFEQDGSANCIDPKRTVSGGSPFGAQPVAMAADLKADDAAAKSLDQNLRVSCVVAEIGNDQRMVVVLSIDRRQRVGTFRSE